MQEVGRREHTFLRKLLDSESWKDVFAFFFQFLKPSGSQTVPRSPRVRELSQGLAEIECVMVDWVAMFVSNIVWYLCSHRALVVAVFMYFSQGERVFGKTYVHNFLEIILSGGRN
jgi:hypothetical protein